MMSPKSTDDAASAVSGLDTILDNKEYNPSGPAPRVVSSTLPHDENGSVITTGTNASAKSRKRRQSIIATTAKAKGSAPGFTNMNASQQKLKIEEERGQRKVNVLFPWSISYKMWWVFTVVATTFTFFFETYQISFPEEKNFSDPTSIIEYTLYGIFFCDILVTFNLAYYDETDTIIFDRKSIAVNYLRKLFWIDLVGVMPFYVIALSAGGLLGENSSLTQNLGLLRLFRLVRLRRVKQLFDILQFSSRISLMSLTIIRNFVAATSWTHFNACFVYFISRSYNFDEDLTWIGGSHDGKSPFQRYCTTLYFSIVTFTTVGYGDFSPKNPAEEIWGMMYMLMNVVIMSYIIGSVTLLVVKNDEKTGIYREKIQNLHQYAIANNFTPKLKKRLKTQLKLDFNNNEISDEMVLQNFPRSSRRKVLRKLYMPALLQTSLLRTIPQQFADEFLEACNIEVFGPGEEIAQQAYVPMDLYFLLTGSVILVHESPTEAAGATRDGYSSKGGSSIPDSNLGTGSRGKAKKMECGDFINEVSFLTESPNIHTIQTAEVCKTLTLSRNAYNDIAQNHPGSLGKILKNLLEKVENQVRADKENNEQPKKMRVSRNAAGSAFDVAENFNAIYSKSGSCEGDDSESYNMADDEVQRVGDREQLKAAYTTVQELVRLHINKLQDDHTTRFLFAASRGDTATVTLMLDQNFDPNSSDYDSRTALMIAAMKGNTDIVRTLLNNGANPNLTDTHGSTALYEAVKSDHNAAADVIIKAGGTLCMDEVQEASVLCQAVFVGDISLLKRLIKARINVNAQDYDSRTAVHIAAAEGNIMALKTLIELGNADVTLHDRWNNSPRDEAERAFNSQELLAYLDESKMKRTQTC